MSNQILLRIASGTVVFRIFPISATLQLEIIKILLKSSLTCATNIKSSSMIKTIKGENYV